MRLTVAPGQCVRLSPHPSGIPNLPALVLYDGDSFTTTEAEAWRLYGLGKVLHPVTGHQKPAQPVENAIVTVIFGGRTLPLSDPSAALAIGAAEREIARDQAEAEYAARVAERAAVARQIAQSGFQHPQTVTVTYE